MKKTKKDYIEIDLRDWGQKILLVLIGAVILIITVFLGSPPGWYGGF